MADAIPVSQPVPADAVLAPSSVVVMDPVVPGPALAEIQVAEARVFAAAATVAEKTTDKELAALAKAAQKEGKAVSFFGNAMRVDN